MIGKAGCSSSGADIVPLRCVNPNLLATQGHAESQSILGIMYNRGLGVPKDDWEAVAWYRRAAAGSCQRPEVAGLKYISGEGVPQDYVRAYA